MPQIQPSPAVNWALHDNTAVFGLSPFGWANSYDFKRNPFWDTDANFPAMRYWFQYVMIIYIYLYNIYIYIYRIYIYISVQGGPTQF